MKKSYLKNLFFMLSFLVVLPALAQTELQKEQITSRYDQQKFQQLRSEFLQKTNVKKQQALQLAQTNNWPLIVENDGKYAELQKVVDGKPIYYTTFNVAAAKSTRVDHLNSGGSLGLSLDGQNMTAYVWDGGIARASHQEYDGAGGSNRFSVGDGSSSLNFHAAHVTGTIIASGVQANAKGMASHANAIGSDWNSDLAEATSAAAGGMLVSNHSYGFAARNQQGQVQLPQYFFGGYIDDSRDWDNLMFNAPNYLMVVAAGNDGDDNTATTNPTGGFGFDKLTGHSTSKNNLVVAAANDANIDSNGNLVSVTIASFSSEGPTDDFRIKPDIAGNGVSVYSTYETSNTAYNSISGTSMASPNVTGSLVLLQQHANNVNGSFMKAATLKGLALHTADDAGATGPDAVFGWGLMNTKAAAEAITQNGNETKIEELTLTSGQTYTMTVDSDGVNDLMASISWTDRAGTAVTTVNSTTPVLVNDLDIRVTKGGTTSFPYELTGALTNAQQDNNVDPYERVDVANATGTYTITVTHKGSLTGGSQNYSLIVTGLTGTPVVCNATTPTGLTIDGFGSSTATVSWDAVPGASYDFRYRQAGTSSWTTSAVSGTSTSLSGLTPETTYQVQVRSACSDGSNSSYSSTVSFTTTEVQLNYCASNGNSVADEYISNVLLGSINNTSGASSGGYADYTSQSTSLTQGDNYSVSITPTWTGTLYDEGYSVWIDYNHDGDFADAGEQVWSQAASQTTPVTGSFSVPNSTYVGATRMRVTMQYNAVPASCGSFNYGEVEDYTVNLGAGVADTTAPVITLTGASTINLNVGATYNELGATATDNVDGNLTSSIVITGSVNTSAVGTYTVNYNVSDTAGNTATQVSRTINVTDGTAPVITLNGASTINLTVGDAYSELGATATDNVDGNLTSSIVITGSVNTAVAGTYTRNYNVSDAAGNAATQVSRTVNVSEASLGGCSGGITSFPYTESFESGLGAWSDVTGDDLNWTRDSGGTPSSNTGPSSGSAGSWYLFVEASSPNYPSKTAILNSPCFDLSAETEASFTFDYHMYGSNDLGSISVEASNDDGSTWTSIWSESGANQGNAWQSVSLNLAAYTGGTVQLRFNRVTGNTWQADISIDNVGVSNGGSSGGNSCTAEVASFPYTEGYENTLGAWTQSSADDINWTVDANGTPSSNTGPSAAAQGSYYIFVEASGNGTGYPNKQAIINSPCYDLNGASSATFSFNYHMYGATDMGTIALEASNDNGASWTSVWSESGNKGNSWLSASVDLAAYLGDTVQLRFNRVTGSTWQADIAIDNINLSANTTTSNYVVTSTNASEGKVEFKLFPNPVKNMLNISVLGFEAESYSIMNALGQIVMKGSFTKSLNVSNLDGGMYILKIETGETVKIKRFMKN